MRSILGLGLLAAVSTIAGCTPRMAGALFRTGADIAVIAAVAGAHAEPEVVAAPAPEVVVIHDRPAPRPQQDDAAFDARAAKTALTTVDYKDCGTGGAVRLQVTFTTEGRVAQVEVLDDTLSEVAARCLATRFEAVRVPAFEGSSHTIAWTIHLPGEVAAPAASTGEGWF